MYSQHTLIPTETTAPPLQGHRLGIAWAAWSMCVVFALSLFVLAVPARYRQLSTPPEAVSASLAQIGMSVDAYATYLTALNVVFAVMCIGVGAVVVRRKGHDRIGLFVSLLLILLGTVNVPHMSALKQSHPQLLFVIELGMFLTWSFLLLFGLLFPDGRFIPRWSRFLALGWTTALLLAYLVGGHSLIPPDSSWVGLTILGGLVSGVGVQVYRYRYVATSEQRQQIKWVVFGTLAAFIGQLSFVLLVPFFPSPIPPDLQNTSYDLISVTGVTCSYSLIPLSLGVAVLRYRLWDIDPIINRTLVYGALTACVVAIYVFVVTYLSTLLRTESNVLISLVATGIVAVIFQPLRQRLQRGVNRMMYGERDEPYVVISRLGQRLEATLAPDAVLPTIVETVKDALKLPYAAIALQNGERRTMNDEVENDEGFEIIASSGVTPPHLVTLPLVYQHETLGKLILAPRAPGESFSSADRRLLDDLARQAGVAAHAVRLTTDLQRLNADLQRSREELITAREEERRRLRRDLHDGVGPTLASLAQRLDAARSLVGRDPEAATALLGDLKGEVKSTITDIRRLVYALRPPVLDEFGLLSAIKEYAAQYEGQHAGSPLHIVVDAAEHLPPLPAAVEVAAYRIVLEALTNVVRHARAQRCTIRLDLRADALHLEVVDDGVGIPDGLRAGVGIASMRERAAELGGMCIIEPIEPHGTRVWAQLPLGNLTQRRKEA